MAIVYTDNVYNSLGIAIFVNMAIVYTDNVYNFNIYMSCPRLDPSLLPESKDVHPDMAGE